LLPPHQREQIVLHLQATWIDVLKDHIPNSFIEAIAFGLMIPEGFDPALLRFNRISA
jgi:hypothetical protein